MTKCIPVAVIKAPHGVKGLVSIHPYSGDYACLTEYGTLTNQNETQSFDIKIHFEKKGSAVCEIKGIQDRTAIEKLVGTELYAKRSNMPQPASEKEFYVSDLEGLEIRSPKGDVMGKIIRVDNFGAGDLLDAEIVNTETGERESHYIPFTDACVPTVDIDEGFVVITPPRGLFAKEEKPKTKKGSV